MNDLSHIRMRLGASLYVPATRKDLSATISSPSPMARSLIVCTEDAVRHDELEPALKNLEGALAEMTTPGPALRFIRARNPHVLGRILSMTGIEKIDGFVIPKATAESLPRYLAILPENERFLLMPTVETKEAFDARSMRALRKILSGSSVRDRTLAIRIGGNDLLSVLGLRRPLDRTIYETPVGDVISSLVGIFRPEGIGLTAPVFEGIGKPDVLEKETIADLGRGLVGKTAIHPSQIPIIERVYRVSFEEMQMADAVLSDDAPAVFRLGDRMCEPATHAAWARETRLRAAAFGVERNSLAAE
jgi:citrate lyase beta subunit